MKDNGYANWQKVVRAQKKKRFKLFCKISLIYLVLAVFIFFFGYDLPMFAKEKFIEFFPPFLFLFLIIIIVVSFIYKIPKYIPLCNKCGKMISDIELDCVIGEVKYLGTVDKTEYKNLKSTIKGKTVYPRGGYSMRNSVMEYSSESTFEINQNVPFVKRYHVYNVSYKCKNCGEVFCKVKKESIEPLDINSKDVG